MNSKTASKDRRSQLKVKTNFQKKYLALIAVSLIVSMALSIVILYLLLYWKIRQAGFSLYTIRQLSEVYHWLLFMLPAMTIILLAAALTLGNYLAFKLSGPLYALEKQIIMLLEGMITRVQLRDNDHELIPLANLINELIDKKNSSDTEK